MQSISSWWPPTIRADPSPQTSYVGLAACTGRGIAAVHQHLIYTAAVLSDTPTGPGQSHSPHCCHYWVPLILYTLVITCFSSYSISLSLILWVSLAHCNLSLLRVRRSAVSRAFIFRNLRTNGGQRRQEYLMSALQCFAWLMTRAPPSGTAPEKEEKPYVALK